MLILEDSPESRVRVRDQSPHFEMFPEFEDTSYADHYNIFTWPRASLLLHDLLWKLANTCK